MPQPLRKSSARRDLAAAEKAIQVVGVDTDVTPAAFPAEAEVRQSLLAAPLVNQGRRYACPLGRLLDAQQHGLLTSSLDASVVVYGARAACRAVEHHSQS